MPTKFENVAELIRKGQVEEASSSLEALNANSDEARVEKLHLEGFLAERDHDWSTAAAKYREALSIDDDHSETLFRLAYLLDLHGDDEQAMELYQRCINEPPPHVNAMMNLAVMLEDQGRNDEALSLVQRVLAQHPNHLKARLFLKDIESSLTMYYDEEREATREKRDAVLDIPITDFELSVRSRNCLKQMNIHTIGDLLRITEQKLLAYKNFGETSLNEIKAMLAQTNLRLGQALEEGGGAAAVAAVTAGTLPQTAAAAQTSTGDPNLVNRSVAELELSVRSRKCLQRLGVQTIGELTRISEPELLAAKNFGQTSLQEIKRRLQELGLSLRGA